MVLLDKIMTVVFEALILMRLLLYHLMTAGSVLFVFFTANSGVSPYCSMIQSSANK